MNILEVITPNGQNERASFLDSENAMLLSYEGETHTAVVGIFENSAINQFPKKDRLIELLLRAVNNRTRERNYFRLYTQFLEEEVTEDDFNKEIDDHEDEYVVSNDADFKPGDVELALSISSKIKDVNDLDSMVDLFSFDMRDVKKCIEANNGQIY